jgi:PAS domain S-box-containing protein
MSGTRTTAIGVTHRRRQTMDLSQLFDLAPEAMLIVDDRSRVLKANQEFTNLFGWRLDELAGRPIDDFIVPPELKTEASAAGTMARTGRRSFLETERCRRDGSRVAVSVHCTPITSATGEHITFSIYKDISQRVRAEYALRQSEEKFEKAFRASPDAMVISTVDDGRIIDVNHRYLALFGFDTREEVIGHTVAELGIYASPDERQRVVDELTVKGFVADVDCRINARGRGVRIFQVSVELLEIGGKQRMLSVGRDVTDARAARSELMRSRSRLRDLAARLETVREEERASMSREIHDELGQELTGLRLELSWLQRAIPTRSNLHERVKAMVTQVDGTIDTVRRIASDLRPGVLDELGLAAAVEWQGDRFEERTGLKPIVRVTGDGESVDARRATAVFRILQEALTNVARHAQATQVCIGLEITPAAVTLEVEDDGVGISGWDVASAQGLGLVGMRERAIQWDGEIEISGAPGRGTRIRLVLPQARTGEMAIA